MNLENEMSQSQFSIAKKNREFFVSTLEDATELRKFVSEHQIEVVSVGMGDAARVGSFVVKVF